MKKEWLKRVLSLALAMVLLAGGMPTVVFSQEMEEGTTENTEIHSEQEPGSDEETPAEEAALTNETATFADEVAPSDATEATQTAVTVYEEVITADTEGWPTNEELFAVYAEGILYGNTPATFGTSAYDRLTEEDINVKLAYEAMKPELEKIARGERASAVFTMGYEFEDVLLSDGSTKDFPAEFPLEFQGTTIDTDLLLYSILTDMPYEMYWSTKNMGIRKVSGGSYMNLTISFEVAGNYAPEGATGGYTADKTKTGAASAAAANAQAVAEGTASLSDYEKLVYFKEYICGAVGYDWDGYNAYIADNAYALTDSDPWQLIHVFDGNDSTNVVCEGYAKAFQYLCDLVKFQGDVVCYCVSGDMNGGGHMWNIVTIDGAPYLVDVTNSDSGMVGQSGGLFLVGSEKDASGNYTFTVGGKSITYVYGDSTRTLWDSDVLTLSTNAIYEPPTEEADTPTGTGCDHEFSDGSCTKCDILGGQCGENVYWTLDEAGLLTVYGEGEMDNYGPNNSPWNQYDESIKMVNIEDGVTSIGQYVFYGCTAMESVEIADSVTAIGYDAFYRCESLTAIEIPNGVTAIETATFRLCKALTDVAIPESVTIIEEGAFSNCASLEEISIPDSVTCIETGAFIRCTALCSIEIPASVTTYGESIFEYCTALTRAVLPENITAIPSGMFFECNSLSSINIPESVTAIGDYAFQRCWGLTEIDFPENLATIGEYAFWNCNKLEEIVIPNSVTMIGRAAFQACKSLAKIKLSENLSSIANAVFMSCEYLEEIVIPENVTAIGEQAFDDCWRLWEITFEGNCPEINGTAFAGVTANGYYLADNSTWTEEKLQDYGGDITWVPYCVGEHSYGEWEITQEVTATSEGQEQQVCSACGQVRVRKIVPVQMVASVTPSTVTKGAKAEDVTIGLSASAAIGGEAVTDLEMDYVITDKDGREVTLEEALSTPGEYTITPKIKDE